MSNLQPGDQLAGFEVKRTTKLKTAPAVVYELEHCASGARLVHYSCDDPENLFSISFPTPPSDDTGVPHILEHVVLSGSNKFPVKDPFFAMAKISMATFLNAMTGSNCTYYPVASNVKQDLFNLASVYFDAVFHPLITEDTFAREGHHFAPADPKAPTGDLVIKGVVYNEMLAYAADPGYRFWREPFIRLLKDTIFVHESGGDPDVIPDLTYESFTNFYKTFYSPSNALFFFYGDIPTTEFLGFLTGRMKGFGRSETPPAALNPEPWNEPQESSDTYPIGESEPDNERTYFGMFWLTGDALDPQEHLLMSLLSTILVGNDAAPLKKAVVDSRLGKGLAHSGESSIGPHILFSVGLKGSESDKRDAFESLVLSTLRDIADKPIDSELVDAAFQQIAYSSLEVVSGHPLKQMSHTLEAWLYEKDPTTFLEMPTHIEACRARCTQEPDIFNKLIISRLLENNHRLFHTLTPDREWQNRHAEETKKTREAERKALSDEEMGAVSNNAARLQKIGDAPDRPEDLAKLPRLEIKDLPSEPRTVPAAWAAPSDNLHLARNDVFSNGVNYLEMAIDMSGLPEQLWQYVPHFCQAFTHMGTQKCDYSEIARRKAAHTGGLGCQHSVMTPIAAQAHSLPFMMLSLKTLDGRMDKALDIVEDLLFGLNPRDMDRLSVLTQQALTDARKNIVQNAMRTATVHAQRSLSDRGHIAHLTEGLHQLSMLESICADDQAGLDRTATAVEAIRDFIVANGSMTAGFTGSNDSYGAVADRLASWSDSREKSASSQLPAPASGDVLREGLACAIDISYCACAFEALPYMHEDSPFLELGAHIVSHEYILKEIRVKGTAYGAGFRYAPNDQGLLIYSYRDPAIANTLSVIKGIPDFVKHANWSQDEIEQAAIAVAKTYLTPVRPGSATRETLQHELIGMSAGIRADRFARIKSATPADVKRAVLETVEANLETAPVCVVSNRPKLEEANASLQKSQLSIEEIL